MAKLSPKAAQLLRFLLAGLIVVAIDAACYSLLVLNAVNLFVANIVGMSAGFLSGFFLHKTFTFQLGPRFEASMFLLYFLTFLVNVAIAHWSLQALYSLLGEPFLAKFITMGIVFISNFLISKYVVFRRPQ